MHADITEGSWRYDEQAQIHVYTYCLPIVHGRAVNNGVSRIEIPSTIDPFKKYIKENREALDDKIARFM